MAGEVPDTEARYEPTKKKICYMQKHCPNLHLFLNSPASVKFILSSVISDIRHSCGGLHRGFLAPDSFGLV